MVFSVLRRRNAQSEAASPLPSAVAVFMVFTFVLFGVVESAFAQRFGSVQKRSPKRVEENVPRIMPADPPEHGVPRGPVQLEGVIVEAPRYDPPIYPWTPGQPSQPGTPGGQPSNPDPGGGGTQPADTTPPPPRVQKEFCTCVLQDYSHSIDDPRNVNCNKTPKVHYTIRLAYSSRLESAQSVPAKSHTEVCQKGDKSGASKTQRKRITDYPVCGDDNSEYEPLEVYDHDRCSN